MRMGKVLTRGVLRLSFYVHEYFACMCVHVPHGCRVLGKKRALGPWGWGVTPWEYGGYEPP